MQIIIKGPPIAKARPRFARCGKFSKVYDPQKQLKDCIIFQIKNQIQQKFSSEIPLVMNIEFSCTISSSISKNEKNLNSWDCLFHVKKCDLDNFSKWIMDLLNDIAYHDDRQIVELNVKKVYSNEDKTVIEIMPKATYDDALNEFISLIDQEDFCHLCDQLQLLSKVISSKSQDTSAENKFSFINSGFLVLREISSRYGKIITEIAKKHKNLKEKVEKENGQSSEISRDSCLLEDREDAFTSNVEQSKNQDICRNR